MAIAAPIIWAAIVFLLHVVKIPSEHEPRISIPHADKVVHFAMFSALSFLMWRSAMFFGKRRTVAQWLVVMLFCLAYGASLEWYQGISGADRDSDFYDWIADLIGTLSGLGVAATKAFSIFFRHQLRKPS